MVKVAVEEPFVSVKDALEKKGYNAEMLKDKTDAVDYDCVVVRDLEDLADFHMNVPLVEAKGRTLYEIVEEVEERLVRSGKLPAPETSHEGQITASGFLKGAVTGAIVGAAAGLLLAPKSGKEMQEMLKEKTAESKEKLSDTVEQLKEKTAEVSDKTQGKVEELKEKAADVSDKTKGKVDELKTKREEKKEEKEVEKELKAEEKAEEKAVKEHEKAEKQAGKEIKKAEKEADKEKGGIEVIEFGDAEIKKTSTGAATITPKSTTDK